MTEDSSNPAPDAFADLLGTPDDLSAAELQRARAMVLSGLFPREDGSVVDQRYTLQSTIGSGGIGRVYRAHDRKLGRDVAMKFLKSSPGREHSADTLILEAKVLARLQHPNIVGVYDVGRADGEIYLTMELVQGCSLGRWLEVEPRRWPAVVAVFEQAAAGLSAAHRAGVIHRDFKPSNVMVGDDARVRVVDFGLARAFAPASTESSVAHASGTRTHAAGTHQYMAPEQFEGLPSAASDQFGFCTSLFEALVGARTWGTSGPRGLDTRAQRRAAGLRLRKAGAPRWLRSVVLRGLGASPSDRFEDFDALKAALRPPRRTAAALGVAAVVGGGAAVWGATLPSDVCTDRGVRATQMWGQARRAAFLAQERHAADNAEFVRVIDDYVAGWNALDRRSCRANDGGELSATAEQLRAQCLERSLRKVEYFLTQLESPDGPVARPAAARGLTGIAECQDDERLLSWSPPSLYDRDSGDALAEMLGRAYVNKTVGNSQVYFEMLQAAEDSLTERGRAFREELILDTLLGAELNNRGRFTEAEALLVPALLGAERQPGWPAETSRVRSVLATAIGHQPARAAEGLLLARLSAAAASALDDGGAHELAAQVALTSVALAADDVDAALEASARAVEILRHYDGVEHSSWISLPLNAAEALAARGSALAGAGEQEHARAAYEEALAALDELGNRGLTYARIQNNLAPLVEPLDVDHAERLLEQAAEIKEALGMRAEAGLSLMNIGNARVRRGAHASALAAYDRAVTLIQDPTVSEALHLNYNRALALAGLERWADAEADYEAVLDATEELELPDTHPVVFSTLVGLGESLNQQGEFRKAERVLRRARLADGRALGPEIRAELRLGLSVAVGVHDPRRGVAIAREGLELLPSGPAHAGLRRRLRLAASEWPEGE